MDPTTRQVVPQRANQRCEYCLLPESALDVAFHVEHIMARQHGGADDLENRALACDRCDLSKGPNLSGIDQQTGQIVPLFHSRLQHWQEHFRRRSATIYGLTPTGLATVRLLQMNSASRRQLLAELERSE
ncbi:MAG TPA: HNH endonuclease signature motif containing protein [Pirellulales bacterium]